MQSGRYLSLLHCTFAADLTRRNSRLKLPPLQALPFVRYQRATDNPDNCKTHARSSTEIISGIWNDPYVSFVTAQVKQA